MHTSQFHKIDPYDWFCAPGSHIRVILWKCQFLLKSCLLLSSLGLQHHALLSEWLFSNEGAGRLANYATACILLHWLAIDCKQPYFF